MQRIELLKEKVKILFDKESSGHDYFHTLRVYNNAINLSNDIVCDLELIKISALLHDVDDDKIFDTSNYANAKMLLDELNYDLAFQNKVFNIISEISFASNKNKKPTTIEAMIVQDADRLDAIGAIGIARAFAYGGAKGRELYDPDKKVNLNMTKEEYRNSDGTTINHFYEKLLLLKDLMNTDKAKEIAENRTEYMKKYLEEFYQEWDGIK